MNKPFELFICCLGNGLTVCNKAVEKNGDYEKIAHIGNNGKIKWYVSEYYVPTEDKKQIENAAHRQREKYLQWWNGLTIGAKYEYLLNNIPHTTFMEIVKDKNSTMKQKVEKLEKSIFNFI